MIQIMVREKSTGKVEATMDYSFGKDCGSPELIGMYVIQIGILIDYIIKTKDVSLMLKYILGFKEDLFTGSKKEQELLKLFLECYEVIVIKNWQSDINNAKEIKDLFR